MQNLELFYSAIQDKVNLLEIKERQRIQFEIDTYRQKNNESAAKFKEQYLERDIFFWKLQIKYKLFLSLSKFIKDTDILSNFILENGPKGLQIICKVERESRLYNLVTEAISAGGYNIQCFHYRYITTTNLEQISITTNLSRFFRLSEEKERLVYQFEEYKKQPLTVTTYTTQEFQEKSRANNIKSYEDKIAKLQHQIDNLK